MDLHDIGIMMANVFGFLVALASGIAVGGVIITGLLWFIDRVALPEDRKRG